MIGGENEELSDSAATPSNDEKQDNAAVSVTKAVKDEVANKTTLPEPAVTQIDTTGAAAAKEKKEGSESHNSDDSKDDEEDDDDEEESPSKSLNDVWVFDTHLLKWLELTPSLYIQGSGAGKRIRKQFEPRMAHSAVIIDQFVVVFGGLNKETNSLISNDLYILCLNGITNALLPKDKIDEKKPLLIKKPIKPVKPVAAIENGNNSQPVAS